MALLESVSNMYMFETLSFFVRRWIFNSRNRADTFHFCHVELTVIAIR
jgi:hypothetical protein